jgi:hypothetical protein
MNTLKPMSSSQGMDVERPNANSGSSRSEERTEERRVNTNRPDEGASPEGRPSPEPSSPMSTALDASSGALEDEWSQAVAEFVDDPRRAVTRAHELVGRALQAMIEDLHAQHSAIEQQWKQAAESNTDLSTETLRVCLQQYRAFAQRISASTESHEMSLSSHQGTASPTRH